MTAKAYRVGRLAVMEAALRGAKARHRNCAGDRRPCSWVRLARDGPSSLRTVLAVLAELPCAAR
jgi:hypothetical protein